MKVRVNKSIYYANGSRWTGVGTVVSESDERYIISDVEPYIPSFRKNPTWYVLKEDCEVIEEDCEVIGSDPSFKFQVLDRVRASAGYVMGGKPWVGCGVHIPSPDGTTYRYLVTVPWSGARIPVKRSEIVVI